MCRNFFKKKYNTMQKKYFTLIKILKNNASPIKCTTCAATDICYCCTNLYFNSAKLSVLQFDIFFFWHPPPSRNVTQSQNKVQLNIIYSWAEKNIQNRVIQFNRTYNKNNGRKMNKLKE